LYAPRRNMLSNAEMLRCAVLVCECFITMEASPLLTCRITTDLLRAPLGGLDCDVVALITWTFVAAHTAPFREPHCHHLRRGLQLFRRGRCILLGGASHGAYFQKARLIRPTTRTNHVVTSCCATADAVPAK